LRRPRAKPSYATRAYKIGARLVDGWLDDLEKILDGGDAKVRSVAGAVARRGRHARHEQERGEPPLRGAHARRAGCVDAATARRAGPRRAHGRRHRVGEHTLVVAIGIDSAGKKHALAIREGSTENATLCRSLLADLVARGVPADRSILVVIDGGTGLRSAVKHVFGDYALVQRCQVHKKRNVIDHLPEHAKPHVRKVMQDAYALDDYDKAKAQLERLAKSLDEQHPSAASSLREGLDETLTVLRLSIGPTLRKSLSTTNPIESTFSTVRRVSRRVTRWQNGTMTLRWALAGTMEAEKTWRRLMGKADLPKLVTALRRLDLARATPPSVKRAAA
jgi:hypothetical protein